ncbi:hypothetical protein N7470_004975 [Penicillium chermesinum]|nr:hypothetical protein N7470_004975 [Penicillium chermesinum]
MQVLVPLTALTTPLQSWGIWGSANQVSTPEMVCGAANYTTEIVSLDPLAVYINGFMSKSEIAYLRNLVDLTTHRQLTHLARDDPMVECIIKRSTDFVGFIPHDGFEALQVVRYFENERHDPHFDWFQSPPKIASGLTCNRAASFFVYLGDEPEGGETCFHYLYPAPPDADPKKFSNINSDDGLGVAVKPITGNAMFWMNLYSNNTGDPRVQHSALPIRSGTKYGMNILLKRCWE